jgi:hypothetical protein
MSTGGTTDRSSISSHRQSLDLEISTGEPDLEAPDRVPMCEDRAEMTARESQSTLGLRGFSPCDPLRMPDAHRKHQTGGGAVHPSSCPLNGGGSKSCMPGPPSTVHCQPSSPVRRSTVARTVARRLSTGGLSTTEDGGLSTVDVPPGVSRLYRTAVVNAIAAQLVAAAEMN